MQDIYSGFSEKMQYRASPDAGAAMSCNWTVGGQTLPISQWLGAQIRLEFTGAIHCSNCGQATKRSYSQGYCYNCFKRLARCDLCMMAPTRCHYDKGTCREPQWGESFCFAPHLVYLANSSDLKVGITRPGQEFTRWTDQGAEQGLVILYTDTRQLAGAMEATLGQWVSDRSNWRKLISEQATPIDLRAQADALLARLSKLPTGAAFAPSQQPQQLIYPVQDYAAPKSLKLKTGEVLEGELRGIRGQYLLFEQGALNVRNLTSMEITVTNLSGAIEAKPLNSTTMALTKSANSVAEDDDSQMELFK